MPSAHARLYLPCPWIWFLAHRVPCIGPEVFTFMLLRKRSCIDVKRGWRGTFQRNLPEPANIAVSRWFAPQRLMFPCRHSARRPPFTPCSRCSLSPFALFTGSIALADITRRCRYWQNTRPHVFCLNVRYRFAREFPLIELLNLQVARSRADARFQPDRPP